MRRNASKVAFSSICSPCKVAPSQVQSCLLKQPTCHISASLHDGSYSVSYVRFSTLNCSNKFFRHSSKAFGVAIVVLRFEDDGNERDAEELPLPCIYTAKASPVPDVLVNVTMFEDADGTIWKFVFAKCLLGNAGAKNIVFFLKIKSSSVNPISIVFWSAFVD